MFLFAVFKLLSASSRSEGAEARAACLGWVSAEAQGTRGSHAVRGSAWPLVRLLCVQPSLQVPRMSHDLGGREGQETAEAAAWETSYEFIEMGKEEVMRSVPWTQSRRLISVRSQAAQRQLFLHAAQQSKLAHLPPFFLDETQHWKQKQEVPTAFQHSMGTPMGPKS